MRRTRAAVERMARQAVPTDEQVRRAVLGSEPDRLLDGILRDPRLRVVPGRGPGRRRWGPVAVVGVAVTAVLAAVAVFVLPDRSDEPAAPAGPAPALTTTDPAVVLGQLADRAAAQPPVGEGTYDYVHVRYVYPGAGAQAVHEVESWLSATGTGRFVRTIDGRPDVDEVSTGRPWKVLPADPDALEDALVADPQDVPVADCPLFVAMGVLDNQVIDPPVQAALLRLLARDDDVRVVGPTTDPLGREGVEVRASERVDLQGYPAGPGGADHLLYEYRFVLDAETGAILGVETLELDAPEGATRPVAWALWLQAGRVDSTDQRPDPSTDPARAVDPAALTPAEPAVVLGQLADRAAAQPAPPAKEFDYRLSRGYLLYSHEDSTPVPPDEQATGENETWLSADGLGRIRNGEPSPDGGVDDTGADAPVDLVGTYGQPARVADLPTDPAAVEAAMVALRQGPWEVTLVDDLMLRIWGHQVLEPQQQAAFLRFWATRDHVRVLGPTTDRVGREGIAVVLTQDLDAPINRETGLPYATYTVENTLILDPRTGALLSRQRVEREGERIVSGTVHVELGAGRVDSVAERP
ncbi:CU044_5270 family protein [Pseudonocardia lacus]|uniref:CU044_5270 family protein n=1 Tax=Pseudonocardia lacus TaxID=2835865 RepID=UPI001BDC6490|nr:CU044_5270 family protein [Pseudonocardia lacus]